MKALWQIVKLELLANFRSRSFYLLTAAVVLWMTALPAFVKSDGTSEGARQICIHYSLAGAFAMVLMALAGAAAGSLSRERAAKRLQLTAVRPVRFFTIAAGRYLALMLVGTMQIALAGGILTLKSDMDLSRPCDHLLSPVLPSVWEEAEAMYSVYMQDEETPEEVRKMDKREVIRLLAAKAPDHYQTVATNETARWLFPDFVPSGAVKVQLRFTNTYDTREDVCGLFRLGCAEGVVSNITQAVAKVPLAGMIDQVVGERVLEFANQGGGSLMLRPRRDIKLLVEADGFGWNLVRALLELTAILSVAIAFAIFLGAGLSRSVAVFTVVAFLVLALVSPAVVEESDEFAFNKYDRIGIRLARVAEKITRPAGSLAPLEKLAGDICVEKSEVAKTILLDFAVYPLVFIFLAALAIPRKQDLA